MWLACSKDSAIDYFTNEVVALKDAKGLQGIVGVYNKYSVADPDTGEYTVLEDIPANKLLRLEDVKFEYLHRGGFVTTSDPCVAIIGHDKYDAVFLSHIRKMEELSLRDVPSDVRTSQFKSAYYDNGVVYIKSVGIHRYMTLYLFAQVVHLQSDNTLWIQKRHSRAVRLFFDDDIGLFMAKSIVLRR